MSKRTVRRDLDPANPTPLTAKERAELEALKAMPDEDINAEDIPTLRDEFWKNAARNPFYRPVKAQTTLRIDADVLAWLKSQGKGYQTRINAILRRAMLAALKDS